MTVEWRPFELRPSPTPTLRPEGDYLLKAWQRSVYPLAAHLGVPIHLPDVSPQPHTHLAWEGFQFARERGLGNEYNFRVLTAFFQDSQDIGSIHVLARLAAEVGLDAADFRTALEQRRYRQAHQAALQQASDVGIHAVPAFAIGGRLLSGLQDRQTLEAVLDEQTRG